MANKDLVNYLEKGKKGGFSFSLLKNKLLEGGFFESDIDEAVEAVKSKLEEIPGKSKKVRKVTGKVNKVKKSNQKRKKENRLKKRKMKRLITKKNESKFVLSAAIRDLNVEISNLNREKAGMQKQLKEISSDMDVDRGKERELQEKIAKLIEREAKLNQEKKNLEVKIDKIADKIGKISKIKSEMSEL